ncbi:hypothetical protein DXG01_003543 [Tephrocybe rancida]|nr:hypothetical protein DXG01_003543 [Tephrocybe rancida]
MNFGSCEWEAYQKEIVLTFGRFLMKCYTVEDCRARALQDVVLSLSSTIEEHADYASCSRLDNVSQPCSPSMPAASASTTPPGSPPASRAVPPSPFIGSGLPIALPQPSTGSSAQRSPFSQSPCCPPLRSPSPTHLVPQLRPQLLQQALCGSSLLQEVGWHQAHHLRHLYDAWNPAPAADLLQNILLQPLSAPQPTSPAAAGSNTSPNDAPVTTRKRLAKAGTARPSKKAKTASMLASTPAKSPGAQGLAEKHPYQDPDAHSSKKLKTATVSGTALAQPGPRPQPCPLSQPAVCRVSLSPSPSPSPTLSPSLTPSQHPPCSPTWFESSLAMLKSNDSLGEEWTALVQFWTIFGSTKGYGGNRYLSAKHRPSFIGEWIERRRSSTFVPVKAENLKMTEDSMIAWWNAIP